MSDALNILPKIADFVSARSRLFVAYSGGVDSTVLLDVLVKSEWKGQVVALHVDHGLSSNSGVWAEHCQQFCDGLGVALDIKCVKVDPGGSGIEAAARDARYDFFASKLEHDTDLLLTAHHADDQAETMLYRLARGTGLAGLAAIHQSRVFGKGRLLRPLLDSSRADIERYAAQHSLKWIEDESNLNEAFDRNFLRQSVLPLLTKRWPDFSKQSAKAASFVNQSQALLNGYLDRDLQACDRRRERYGESLSIEHYVSMPAQKCAALVRRWCELAGLSTPEAVHIEQLDSVIHAGEDAKPCLNWGVTELRRYKGRLYLMETLKNDPPQNEISWDGISPLRLGDGFVLTNKAAQNIQSKTMCLRISFRKEGVRDRPQGRAHSQTLKKLFQEYQLEPWLRHRVPLIYLEDQLIAVGDLWVSHGLDLAGQMIFNWEHQTSEELGEQD